LESEDAVSTQTTLLPLGNKPAQKSKAKVLPKVAPAQQLTAAQELERKRNQAAHTAARKKMKVGDLRMSGRFCKCGTELIEVLDEIVSGGGQRWDGACPKCVK
jgi:hypothetical protein